MPRLNGPSRRGADTLWWGYVAVLITAGAARMIERIQIGAGGFVSRFGPLVGAIIVASAIVLWRRRRAAIGVWLWRAVYGVVVLAALTGLAYSAFLFAASVHGPATIVLLAALLLMPGLWALHHYSYRASAVWIGHRRRQAGSPNAPRRS